MPNRHWASIQSEETMASGVGNRKYDYERSRRAGWGDDRGRWSERGDDERSWFGEEDAERRRIENERRFGYRRGHRSRGRDYEYGGYQRRGGGYEGAYPGYDRPWAQDYGGEYGYDPYRYSSRYSTWPDYEEGYGRGPRFPYGGGYYNREFSSGDWERERDRDFLSRAGDEIASWFGDEEAARRREMDARHRGRGPKNYVRSDERIREDVNDGLSDDPHIDASDVEVTVSDREVTLDGTVSERFAKRHAEDIAESVLGVKHVQNNLRVRDDSEQPATLVAGTSARSAEANASRSKAGRG
jgi:osmotically-inducible protein OsmY